jgi:uncharacterized protein (DUF433 family)
MRRVLSMPPRAVGRNRRFAIALHSWYDGGKGIGGHMPTLDSVVRSDPEVLGGTPVFAGTRVPLKNLMDYLAAGDSLERFLDHFPSVTRAQAVAALEIARDLLTARATPAR